MTTSKTALPYLPNTADEFVDMMEQIWDGQLHRFYNDWHDANKVAKAAGLAEAGTTEADDNDPAGINWQFPNGDIVWVLQDGSGASSRNRHVMP